MMSMIRLNVLATLDKDSPAEIEALKKRYNDGDGHTMDFVKSNCPYCKFMNIFAVTQSELLNSAFRFPPSASRHSETFETNSTILRAFYNKIRPKLSF